jgi:hypothetical protein
VTNRLSHGTALHVAYLEIVHEKKSYGTDKIGMNYGVVILGVDTLDW